MCLFRWSSWLFQLKLASLQGKNSGTAMEWTLCWQRFQICSWSPRIYAFISIFVGFEHHWKKDFNNFILWNMGFGCSLCWHSPGHQTAEPLRGLHLVKLKLFSNPWFTDKQHSGFEQIFSGVLFVLVKGASHQVPQSKRA